MFVLLVFPADFVQCNLYNTLHANGGSNTVVPSCFWVYAKLTSLCYLTYSSWGSTHTHAHAHKYPQALVYFHTLVWLESNNKAMFENECSLSTASASHTTIILIVDTKHLQYVCFLTGSTVSEFRFSYIVFQSIIKGNLYDWFFSAKNL